MTDGAYLFNFAAQSPQPTFQHVTTSRHGPFGTVSAGNDTHIAQLAHNQLFE